MILPGFSISEDSIAQAGRSEMDVSEIVALFSKVVAGSFKEERVRGDVPVVHLEEIKRRTEIAWKWFRIMRFDCGYTADRAKDFLPTAVRKEIDGVPWEPPGKDRGWSPYGLAKSGG